MSGEPAQRRLILYLSMSLAAHGLIDKYRINVQPVAPGDGLSLRQGLPEPQPLELVASTARAGGPITQTYVPRPERTD
ncbi:MAG: hypothetical protein ACRDPM_17440 [Solirubrobacteraceae bacterium]